MSQPLFSNHAGTMWDSFAIGKQGIKLLQGTTAPTGLSAPAGSLYVLKASSGGVGRVHQIDFNGNWVALLSPSDIIQGDGITVNTNSEGQVVVEKTPTTYTTSFTAADLVDGEGDGVMDDLRVVHNLGQMFCLVAVFNSNNQIINPDHIDVIDENTLTVDLASYLPLAGTWNICVKQ